MTPSAFVKRLRRSSHRFPRESQGSTAIEFAIVAPVLVTFIIGTLMLGIAYYQASTIQWSLERSIRAIMIDENTSLSDIEAAMADDLDRIGNPDVELTYTLDTSGSVTMAVITADYNIPLNIPFVPLLNLHYTIEDVVPLPES
jgi:Flp pilus assembly protein TadG